MSYSTIGNVANVVVLAASLVYAGVVLVDSPMLDPTWVQDGFCIQNRDVHYWSSFDTCLYVDVIFSTILGFLWMAWKKYPSMNRASELVPMVILSTIGHGLAHGQMALTFRSIDDEGSSTTTTDQANDLSTVPWWKIVAFVALFWFPLLKASLHKLPSWIVAFLAIIVTYFHRSMPKEFGFGYVQTVVSMAFHSSQLMLTSSEKNFREYAMLPITASLPVITAWNEALFCDVYFKDAGGHMLYDASIILSFIAFYMDAYYFNVLSKKSSSSISSADEVKDKKVL